MGSDCRNSSENPATLGDETTLTSLGTSRPIVEAVGRCNFIASMEVVSQQKAGFEKTPKFKCRMEMYGKFPKSQLHRLRYSLWSRLWTLTIQRVAGWGPIGTHGDAADTARFQWVPTSEKSPKSGFRPVPTRPSFLCLKWFLMAKDG